MGVYFRFVVPVAGMLPLLSVMAETPELLNSNNVDNTVPVQHRLEQQYAPARAETSLPAQGTSMSFPAETRIALNNVLIEGGTVYPFEEIAAPFSALIGKEVSLQQLAAITERITQRYKDDGYALSYAFIPAQNLSFGQVRIVLVEGYVAHHESRGEAGSAAERIRRFAAHIVGERPLRKETFERYTALMASIPGLNVKATVPAPTTTDGAVTLLTEATRKGVAFNSALELNEQDDPKLLLSVDFNSHTTAGEQLKLTTTVPEGDDRERYARVDYSQFAGDQGTRLIAMASAYRSEKEEPVNLDANGAIRAREERRNDRLSLGVSHPFRLSNSESLTATARLYGVDDERHYRVNTPDLLAGESARITSRIRALALEGEWRLAEQDQLRILSGGLYQGLDLLGARSDIAPLNGASIEYKDIDFLRMRLAGVQSNLFADRWHSVVSGAFYWSADELPASERVAFGGRSFGRGYPSDQAEGDKGWGLAYELGYRFYPDYSWLSLIQPYGAVDAARLAYNGNEEDSSLGSYALGIRFGGQRYYSLSLEAAKPFGDRAADSLSRDPRFRLNVSYSL
ncbi:hypothetical protein B6S08_15805 [Oceanimonas doudoroffii]|uniref:Hemolysin activation/secretion protein n=2 Tax=Oceanimonas doudoroffii TaxID=84158 RepID=A0A233RBY3_9GAMM|nr:hypothetical protein B6S08_15805 [Oceanimonas doudoroffii]